MLSRSDGTHAALCAGCRGRVVVVIPAFAEVCNIYTLQIDEFWSSCIGPQTSLSKLPMSNPAVRR
jgi:hypothetical protein